MAKKHNLTNTQIHHPDEKENFKLMCERFIAGEDELYVSF